MRPRAAKPDPSPAPPRVGSREVPFPLAIQRLLAWGVLAGALYLAYRNSFDAPFVFDDEPNIVLKARALEQFGDPWTISPVRPVLDLSLRLNHALSGQEVWSYHVFNWLVHLLSAVTLFGTLRRTLTGPRLGERFRAAAFWLSLGAALLWAVHPLHTQAVTYIVQRAEAMMGLFCLLALYAAIRAHGSPRPRLWWAAAAVAAGLSLATKPSGAVAPLLVWVYYRVFFPEPWTEPPARRYALLAAVAAGWLALCGAALWLSRHGTAGFTSGRASWEYAQTQSVVILYYLRLAVWPVGLCFDYGWPGITGWAQVGPAGAVLLALLGFTGWGVARRRPWAFPGAWFFLTLAPTSSVMPIKDAIFEYRMYLPLAALSAGLALGAHLVIARFARGGSPVRAAAAASALCALLAVAAGALTDRRNELYGDPPALWRDALRICPDNHRAYTNLSHLLTDRARADRGAYQEALKVCGEAIARGLGGAEPYINRATIYGQLERYDLAFADANRAVELEPEGAGAYSNRGLARMHLEQYDEAYADFTRANALKPDDPSAYYNRALLAVRRGRPDDAFADLDRAAAARMAPHLVHDVRAMAHMARGDPAQALAAIDRSLALRPNRPESWVKRADCHLRLGRVADAWSDVARARALGYEPDREFLEMLHAAADRERANP